MMREGGDQEREWVGGGYGSPLNGSAGDTESKQAESVHTELPGRGTVRQGLSLEPTVRGVDFRMRQVVLDGLRGVAGRQDGPFKGTGRAPWPEIRAVSPRANGL